MICSTQTILKIKAEYKIKLNQFHFYMDYPGVFSIKYTIDAINRSLII